MTQIDELKKWLNEVLSHYEHLHKHSGTLILHDRVCWDSYKSVQSKIAEIEGNKAKVFYPNDVLADGDFWVECNVCKTQLKNWTGSTPCCGSIAWLVEDGKPTKKLSLFASVGGEPIKTTTVDVGG